MILSMMLGHDDELPLIVPSFLTAPSARTYTIASYPKPGMAYDFLKDALGDETFTKALHTYMEEWHGKHPTPFDFFNSFSRGAGENLDWFWDPWFFERGYADLAIKNVNFENDQCNVTISREGILPLPVIVKFIFADNTNQIVKNSTSVWKDGNREFVLHYKPAKKIIRIELGGIDIPDVDRSNNNFIVK